MLLRASGEVEGGAVDVRAITGGEALADETGVPHASLLVAFADALLARDEAALERLRGELIAALGEAGLRETASVASNFQRMVRIADATGIPQDAPVRAMGADLIDELDLRSFASAENTPAVGPVGRVVGGALRKLAPLLLRRMGSG